MAKQVLVVDDDPATRSGLLQLLETAGFDATGFGELRDALQRLRTSPPDLLITDIRLGAFNGLRLVIDRPEHVPAIVMTGFDDSLLESEAVQQGAAYMRKPINPAELLGLVHRLLDDDEEG
jgi:DNA-binding NtrC family response regulator